MMIPPPPTKRLFPRPFVRGQYLPHLVHVLGHILSVRRLGLFKEGLGLLHQLQTIFPLPYCPQNQSHIVEGGSLTALIAPPADEAVELARRNGGLWPCRPGQNRLGPYWKGW